MTDNSNKTIYIWITLLCCSMIIYALLPSAAFTQPDNGNTHTIWLQEPDLSLTGFHTHNGVNPLRVADDWVFGEVGEITDLHWWGYYDAASAPVGAFEISVYADVGGAPDLGSGPLWIQFFPIGYGIGEVRENAYGMNTQVNTLVYYYELVAPVMYINSGVYWLAIMPLTDDPAPLIWHWQSSASMNMSPAWQWDELGYQTILPHDMAFAVTIDPNIPLEFGDAPEGEQALAYPAGGVTGAFPTCKAGGPVGWIEHNNFGAYFGPAFEFELDGDAGLCPPPGCFPTYDDDECFADNDAGLLLPEPFTIDSALNVVPCPNFQGMPLGISCQTAVWGGNVDIDVHNHMPNKTIGYVNVLMDWNQDGRWGGASQCPDGTAVPEHVLVNFPVPNPYDGPLSALMPPNFMIGPNVDYVWSRFTISERPVPLNWDGEGVFEDGETEDYLLLIMAEPPEAFDWGDAPDLPYPTLMANNGAHHLIVPGFSLGPSIDSEPDGQPNMQASGDDLDIVFPPTNDDEDGIVFKTAMLPGTLSCVDVTLTGNAGFLDAWIDFDGDGVWSPAEQIFGNPAPQPLVAGLNPNLCFSVPTGANRGPTFARFRLTLQGGQPPDGFAPSGEVEDYLVHILPLKWNQPPQYNPDSPLPDCFWGWDERSVYDHQDYPIVADDWPCIDDRPITDIHWWGSYFEWNEVEPPLPKPDGFHIGIWTDIPAGADAEWSHPGMLIWEYFAPQSRFTETAVGCDFVPGMEMQDTCYRYDLLLPQEFWFYQQPDTHQIYWISIAAVYPQMPENHVWGWKTREYFFNDAAIRMLLPNAPVVGDVYLDGFPIMEQGMRWDMAFALSTVLGPPQAPHVSIAVVNTTDVELSWPRVLTDIYGNPISMWGYHIYRENGPYYMPADPVNLVGQLPGPFTIDPVIWGDAGKIGNPLTNNYYFVKSATLDSANNLILSAPSNHVGEFDFSIIPGSP